MPPRRGGLGPQGRRAVSAAAAASSLTAADVTEPLEEITNPANIVVSEALPEAQTMPQDWLDFDSSRIASAGYDADSQRLYVLFHKPFPAGTPWTYHGVPPSVWRNMRRAKSAGKFVNRVLNGYRYNPGEWG